MESLYKALNEEEAMEARHGKLEAGEYEGIVRESKRSMSKQGNVMADMYISVYDKAGNIHDIRDFLVFTPKMIWKLKHFCDSSGQQKEYSSENFVPESAINKHVRVRIATRKGEEIPPDRLNGKPPGSCYPDRIVIEDYIKQGPASF